MKLEVNIGNRQLMFLVVFVAALFAVGMAGAYNNPPVGGTPSVAGHSVDEIDWSQTVPQICMGTPAICKTGWPSIPRVYDSGWFPITTATSYTKTHSLGTTKVLATVYLAQNSDGSGWLIPTMGSVYSSGNYVTAIVELTSTTVTLRGGSTDLAAFRDKSGNYITPANGYARIILMATD